MGHLRHDLGQAMGSFSDRSYQLWIWKFHLHFRGLKTSKNWKTLTSLPEVETIRQAEINIYQKFFLASIFYSGSNHGSKSENLIWRLSLPLQPGDFGGNAHRGTRCYSMQSLAALSTIKQLELELA